MELPGQTLFFAAMAIIYHILTYFSIFYDELFTTFCRPPSTPPVVSSPIASNFPAASPERAAQISRKRVHLCEQYRQKKSAAALFLKTPCLPFKLSALRPKKRRALSCYSVIEGRPAGALPGSPRSRPAAKSVGWTSCRPRSRRSWWTQDTALHAPCCRRPLRRSGIR